MIFGLSPVEGNCSNLLLISFLGTSTGSTRAFNTDERALEVCLQGISRGDDHKLSLIERVLLFSSTAF